MGGAETAVGLLVMIAVAATALAVDPRGLASFGPLRTTIVSAAVLGAATLAVASPTPVRIERSTALAWAVFGAILTLATVLAVDPVNAWLGTPDRRLGWVTWVVLFAAFVVGQRVDGRRVLAPAAAAAALAMGMYALAEWWGHAPVDVRFADGRLGGPFGQPAYLGAAAVLVGPASLGLGWAPVARRWRILGRLGALGAGVCVIASQTRGAALGAAVAGVVVLVARRREVARVVRPAALAGTAALVVIVVAVTPLGGRFADLADGEAQSRLDEWSVAAAVLGDHPVIGVGPEGYRVAFVEAVGADYSRTYGRSVITDRAHNGLLDVGVTAGLPGLVAYGALLALVLRAGWRRLQAADALLVGLAAGVVAYATQQLVLFPLAEIDPLFWLMAGAAVAAPDGSGRDGSRSPAERTRLPRPAAALPAILAVGALLGGALDLAADHALAAAVAAGAQGDHVLAVAEADRATDLRPDSIRAWYLASEVAEGPGTILAVDAAIERIESGLDVSPRDPALRSRHGQLLLERARRSTLPADLDRALEALVDLTAQDPFDPAHHLALGVAHALAGDLGAAAAEFSIAEELAPDDPAAPANLAEALLRLDDVDGALAAAGRALALDPGQPLAASVERTILEKD